MFRHREPELCGYGGLAFYFFSIFHILGSKVPEFAPDFDDPDHTEFGRRDWYRLYAFPGIAKNAHEEGKTPMSYESMQDFPHI